MRPNTIQDILLRLVICESLVLETGCWEYPNRNKQGYGSAKFDGKLRQVHRLVYEHFVGSVPDGKELHHICENMSCANPEHLTPLTHRDHVRQSTRNACAKHAAQTHCKNGHEFTDQNTIRWKGSRACRICRHSYKIEWQRRKRWDAGVRPGNRGSEKTSCLHGHDYTPENTGRDKNGWRYCLTCARARGEARNEQRRSKGKVVK